MSIKTRHPDYDKFFPRWQKTEDFLDGQDSVKKRGELYLPKTSGMVKAGDDGTRQYNAYKHRARVPAIVEQALTGIIGLMFEKDPLGISDEVISNSGLNNTQLARDVMRDAASKGRSILVVDAAATGGNPYVTRYPAECMINWKVDEENPNKLTLAVFEEKVSTGDEYSHETEFQYRKYHLVDGAVVVEVYSQSEEFIDSNVVSLDELPIICIGSIDTSPACDPVPLLPIADCAEAIYQLSADYRHALFLSAQPTPWVSGLQKEQWDTIKEQGIGSSALWWLGDTGATGYLESSGGGIGAIKQAITDELTQAESLAVRVAKSGSGVEAAKTVEMRAMTQHASVYTLADSVSIGITEAQRIRASWAGLAEPEPFDIRTEFSNADAWLAMFNPLNAAINAGNAPRSMLFELLRKAELTQLTDDELDTAIRNEQPVTIDV